MNNGQTVSQQKTDELSVNGFSLVFYEVKLLKKVLTDEQLNKIFLSDDFSLITIDVGYNRKIFSSHSHDDNKHIMFRFKETTDLSTIHVTVNGNTQNVIPKVRHYLVIYDRNTIVIQSVIVFDKNNVSNFRNSVSLNSPLDTDGILQIIFDIKTKEKNGYGMMKTAIFKILQKFTTIVGEENCIDGSADYEEDNESVGIQIWDIDNLDKSKGEVRGEDLEKKYQRELSALMNYKNEHFSLNHMWLSQSTNSVKETMRLHTDVLNDHRILQSERVCVEISQVNYPELRDISASRLTEYGYDSTSIFLWNYIQIIKKYYSRCQNEASILRNDVQELLTSSEKIKVAEKARKITKKKTELYKKLEIHNRIKNSCIENRHKEFIEHGMEATGLDSVYEDMGDIFNQITDGVNVALSAQTSYSNSEMTTILSEIERINFFQSISSTRLALIAIIFAVPSVCTLTDFVVSFNNDWDNLIGRLIILFIAIGLVSLVVHFFLQDLSHKPKEDNAENGKEKS